MFFFVKQKTAYDMRISDWSSDVCSSDLVVQVRQRHADDGGEVVGEDQVEQGCDRMGSDLRPEVVERPPHGVGSGGRGEDLPARQEERRVGKECVSTCRSRGSTFP